MTNTCPALSTAVRNGHTQPRPHAGLSTETRGGHGAWAAGTPCFDLGAATSLADKWGPGRTDKRTPGRQAGRKPARRTAPGGRGGALTRQRPAVLRAPHGRQDPGETAPLQVPAAPEKVGGGGPELPQVLAQPLSRQRASEVPAATAAPRRHRRASRGGQPQRRPGSVCCEPSPGRRPRGRSGLRPVAPAPACEAVTHSSSQRPGAGSPHRGGALCAGVLGAGSAPRPRGQL